ncbi:MAG TPA: alpha/beta fold hydrolase [Caulobacteraceae bacterium]|nr:alpha/beta fold hydrolase [Caulobacteraceae bacterium]
MRRILALAFMAMAWAGVLHAAPPLDTYGKLPAIDLVRLSPSGQKIAFIAVDGETRKLFVRKVDGDALFVNTVGTSKIRDIEWAGDDFVIVVASYTLKSGTGEIDKWSYSTRTELGVVLEANLKTGQIARLLVHDQGDTFGGAALYLGSRKIDDKWCAFLLTYNLRMGTFIYKVDLDTGADWPMPKFQGADMAYLLDTDGQIAARQRYAETTRLWSLLEGATGLGAVAERHSDLNRVSLDGLGRTPGTALVEEDGSQADTYDEYPLAVSSKPTRLFENLQPESFLHDPDSHLLIGAILPRDGGAFFFDPKLQRRFDALRKGFAAYHVHLESMAENLDKAVIKTDGGDDPGTYWLVDLATGKAEDLMSAYPTIDAKDVGSTRMFPYHASDGMALEGLLTLPPGSAGKSLPLVVVPHGGPVDVYDWIGFDFWAQAFASRGYAVFQPNYRGSGGYGAAFREAGMGAWGGKMLTDISDGVSALAQAGIVDPKRVCVAGASYGGYAALAGVTLQHGIYRCAVAISAVTDVGNVMNTRGDSASVASGRYNQRLFGASFAGADQVRAISPLRFAQDADAPILLIHGKDDSVVPFVHSLDMNAALTTAGKPHEFIALEGEDHFWSHEQTRLQILEATVPFVQKYNPAP